MSENQTTPREIIVGALRRMSHAGESHEMAARWIMEDLNAAGWTITRNLVIADSQRGVVRYGY